MARHQYAAYWCRGVIGIQAAGNVVRCGFEPGIAQVCESQRRIRRGAALARCPVAAPQAIDVGLGAAFRSTHLATLLTYRFRFARGIRMTRYAVRHATIYEYGGNVVHSHHL